MKLRSRCFKVFSWLLKLTSILVFSHVNSDHSKQNSIQGIISPSCFTASVLQLWKFVGHLIDFNTCGCRFLRDHQDRQGNIHILIMHFFPMRLNRGNNIWFCMFTAFHLAEIIYPKLTSTWCFKSWVYSKNSRFWWNSFVSKGCGKSINNYYSLRVLFTLRFCDVK